MKHEIKVIKTTKVSRTDCNNDIVTRNITVEIDGIIIDGIVNYEEYFNPPKLSPRNLYKLRLKNPLVSKHEDYKAIRLEILKQLYKMDNSISLAVVERKSSSNIKHK